MGLQVDASGAIRTVDAYTASTTRAATASTAAELTASKLRASFLRLAGIASVGATMAFVVHNTVEAQDAFAQLEAGVRSTGGAAGFSAQQLAAMASDLQRVGTASDEAVEGAQALLLTFTNIRGDIFREATADVLDLAQRMGGDLRGASIQVGKALQDPIRGVTALRRVGVSFSASQQQVIKDLVNTGHAVEAQRLILRELETEFGGAAAAARNTLGGSLKGLKNDFGDLFEVTADSSAGVIGAINDLDRVLLFLKDHLDTVQKTVAFGAGFWIAYTAVVKAQSLAMTISAAVHTANTAALTIETTAVRTATASIAGYETAAVSAGIASETMAVGATSAAAGVSTLAVAGRGLLSVLTGPVGIALALTSIIALLWSYKSASEKAAEGANTFRASLAGRTEEQLRQTRGELDQDIQRAEQAFIRLRNAGKEFRVIPEAERRFSGNVHEETTEFARARERLNLLYAQRNALIQYQRQTQVRPPPMTDMSTPPDRDALRARIAQNEAMVESARQAVALAGVQGDAEERLKIDFDAANKAIEAQADIATRSLLPATIAAIEAERRLKLEALDVAAFRVQAQAREDAARGHAQAIALITAEGTAQTRLRIEYEATNRAIEAQRNFDPGSTQLAGAVEDIDTERVARMAEEQLRVFVELRRSARDEMRGLFEDIYGNGLSAFDNLFKRVRDLFGRLVADLASRRIMSAFGNRLSDSLARLYGGAGKLDPGTQQQRAATALSGSAGALTSAAGALSAAAARLSAPTQPQAVQLEGITATARQRDADAVARDNARGFARAFTKVVVPAMAGFFAGNAFGSSTTSRGLGTFGGGLSGAAAGFATAGPLGAAIGGLTGAIGGFIGASNKRAEEERALREVLSRNSQRLTELNENITGLSLFAGSNVAGAEGLTRALSSLSGGEIRSRDFSEALKGGKTADYLRAYERQFGVTIQELGRMAQQLGIELFDSAGRAIPAALKQLQEALRLTVEAATRFTGSMDDLKLRQDAYNKLFDVPDTPLNKLNDVYARLSQAAPDLLKQMGLANLNLTTEAGRKVLLSGLQDIFKLIDAGLLTPDLLGAFKDKEGLIQALLDAKDGLDAFRNTLGNVTTDFPRAMDLILYEQRYGKGTGDSIPREAPAPPKPRDTGPSVPAPRTGGSVTFSGPIVIQNYAGDDEYTLMERFERGVRSVVTRGGFVMPAEPAE